MDTPAPPPDQVRPTQVGGGEIPVLITLKPSEQSPIKGMNTTENSASLTERKDGSTRLVYSTKNDIKYDTFEGRQWMTPVPTVRAEASFVAIRNLRYNTQKVLQNDRKATPNRSVHFFGLKIQI